MDKRPNAFFSIEPAKNKKWVWEFWDANYVLLGRSVILYETEAECIRAAKYVATHAAGASTFTEKPDIENPPQ